MKEQVIASRNVRRSAAQSKGFVQRPTRRDGSVRANSFSPRALFAYVPKALKVVLVIVGLITVFVGYRVAASASLFQVRTIDVTGTSRISSEEIQSLTRRAVSRTGVWRADLTSISNELSAIPGVRRAVVSRVLPDGLRVRVTERVPAAVVRTAAGHFIWVDDEGVALGEMKPDDPMPAFFIRGWSEEGTEDARKDNAERVKKYLELLHDWSVEGLTERVSEVTLIDLRDLRVQLAGNDSQIEVRLGSQDQGSRLKIALEALDIYKQTARGSSITYVDLQTGRVVIGFPPGSKAATGAGLLPGDNRATEPQTSAKNTNSSTRTTKPESASRNNNQRKRETKTDVPKNSRATSTP